MSVESLPWREGSAEVCIEGNLPVDENSQGTVCFGFGTALSARACYSTEFCAVSLNVSNSAVSSVMLS